jgi:hypothetical protein
VTEDHQIPGVEEVASPSPDGSFLLVRPELVRRVGANGALVLSAIEFRCRVPGADRIEDEAGRWWRASQLALSDATGLSRQTVGRELRKLERIDEIDATKHNLGGISDHTRSYRVSARPAIVRNRPIDSSESNNGRSESVRNRTIEWAESNNHHCSESNNLPSIEEGKEGGWVPEVSSPDPAEPSPHCPQHPQGTDAPCRACGDARQAYAAWEIKQRRRDAEAQSAEARERAHIRAQAIADCDLCDDDGYNRLALCSHNPHQAETNRRGAALARAALEKARTA